MIISSSAMIVTLSIYKLFHPPFSFQIIYFYHSKLLNVFGAADTDSAGRLVCLYYYLINIQIYFYGSYLIANHVKICCIVSASVFVKTYQELLVLFTVFIFVSPSFILTLAIISIVIHNWLIHGVFTCYRLKLLLKIRPHFLTL